MLGKRSIFGGLEKKLRILEVRLKTWAETRKWKLGLLQPWIWKNLLGHSWLLKIMKSIGYELLDVKKIPVLELDRFK